MQDHKFNHVNRVIQKLSGDNILRKEQKKS
ncbi:UNVERIFIED_CONTAM: hypothetical protein ABIC26_005056 [Paenibacillus sp. PvR008]